LPSVSRRDVRRRGVEVWTSGNRVFRTDNAPLVLEAALSLSGDEIGAGFQPRLWGNLREREALERIGHELTALAAVEAAEERRSMLVAPEGSTLWTSNSRSSCGWLTAIVSG